MKNGQPCAGFVEAVFGVLLAIILIVFLVASVKRGCSGFLSSMFSDSEDTERVLAAESANRKWAEHRKSALLEDRIRIDDENWRAERAALRAREDGEYERREREDSIRRATAIRESKELQRQVSEMGLNADRLEDELRTFALKESPRIWQTVQYLRAEMEVQDELIAKTRKTSADLGIECRNDPDFRRACRLRNKLVRSLRRVEDRLSEALVAYKEYQATPSKAEFALAMRKALEDGVLEAGLVKRQYEEMRNEK